MDGQSHIVVNETSYMIDSLPYSESIMVEIDIVNCAGEGARSTVTLTQGIIKFL